MSANHHHEGMNMAIPDYDDIRKMVEEHHDLDSWQGRILHFFHNELFQNFLLFLLILDVVILFIEIFLNAEFPSCYIVERNCVSCCPMSTEAQMQQHDTDDHHTDDHFFRFLSDSEHGHHESCSYGEVTPDYPAFCDPHKYHGIHVAHIVLFSMSVAILIIFMLELNMTLIAMGKKFFQNFFLVFDYVVVALSLVLEFVFWFGQESVAGIAELLILFRLWRFVRVGHGIVHSSVKKSAKSASVINDRVKHLTCLLLANGIEVPEDLHYDKKEVADLQKTISKGCVKLSQGSAPP